MTLTVSLATASYPILIERGAIRRVGSLFSLDRRVLIVTDDGVPKEYAERVAKAAKEPTVVTLAQGEDTKSLASFEKLLSLLLEKGFTRSDCIVAVGGGVIGDLCGFVASAYMRGIDFYNVPTTLLAMVDSSIGGKTGVNYGAIKNPIGAFYQPKGVLIDADVLTTLPPRHVASGLAECIKMALTFEKALFDLIESLPDPITAIETIIFRALRIKKLVVEKDEKEAGLRRVLNFGHTLGHAIESDREANKLYHGECVALGMLPMCSDSIRARLYPLYERLGLPTSVKLDLSRAKEALRHDKKSTGEWVNCVTVNEIGSYTLTELPYATLDGYLDQFPERSNR